MRATHMRPFTAALPAGLDRSLLLGRNQTSYLLLRLLVELLDFLLFLLWREGRVAAHGLNLAVRVLFNLFTLLHC